MSIIEFHTLSLLNHAAKTLATRFLFETQTHLDLTKVPTLAAMRVILRQIPKTTSLCSIHLPNFITNNDLVLLKELPLQRLDLRWCRGITNAGLAHLSSLPLQTLNLRGCYEITDAGLAHLRALPLQTLNLGGCYKITDAGLAHLRELPLQHLTFKQCTKITDTGLAHLRALPLQRLDLKWCTKITDTGLAHLKVLPLQSLNLKRCRKITDAGLAHLSSLPLQTLKLAGCCEITDAGLAHLKTLPLQSLNLEGFDITDAGLAHLKTLPLQSLNLNSCQEITDAGLVHLTAMPLQQVNFFLIANISHVGLKQLSHMQTLRSIMTPDGHTLSAEEFHHILCLDPEIVKVFVEKNPDSASEISSYGSDLRDVVSDTLVSISDMGFFAHDNEAALTLSGMLEKDKDLLLNEQSTPILNALRKRYPCVIQQAPAPHSILGKRRRD